MDLENCLFYICLIFILIYKASFFIFLINLKVNFKMDFIVLKCLTEEKLLFNNDSLEKIKNIWNDKVLFESFSNQSLNIIFTENSLKNMYKDGNSDLLIYNGFFYNKENRNNKEFEMLNRIRNEEWPLNNYISGQYSGIVVTENKYTIFNDLIGLYPLYYFKSEKFIIAGNNYFAINVFANCKLSYDNIILRLTPQHNRVSYNQTIFENIFRLLPGENISFDFKSKKNRSFFDFSIYKENNLIKKDDVHEIDLLIKKNFNGIFENENEINLAISGGVDSRIILSGLLPLNKKINLLTYGKPDYTDCNISIEIAKKFNLDITVHDSILNYFPSKKTFEKYLFETDAVFIITWLTMLENFNKQTNKVLCIGDLVDLLRAKSIKKWMSRKFRKNYYYSKLIGKNLLKLNKLNSENLNNYKNQYLQSIRKQLEKLNYYDSLGINKNQIIENILDSENKQFEFLNNYNFEYLENLEEIHSIFYWGRQNMGTQLNLINSKFRGVAPLTSTDIVIKILNINPIYRLWDDLTHKLLNLESNRKLSKIPTAQIPFLNYSSNYYMKLAAWSFRSGLDQFLIKRMMKKKDLNSKSRLFKAFEHHLGYQGDAFEENFLSYFENESINSDESKNIFYKRRNLEMWPLSNNDILSVACINLILNKYS